MKKPMFLLPTGWNPAGRHVNHWRYVSERQQRRDELCQAGMVPCDEWEPVPRTASLQHVSATGPPLSSIWKSRTRGLMRWPCTVHSANHLFPPRGQRQGSAPAICLAQTYRSLGAGQSTSRPGTLGWCVPGRERLAASAHLCLLPGPPTLSPGNQEAPARAELSGSGYGPRVAQVAHSTTGGGGGHEKRGQGREVMDFARNQAAGQGHSWEELGGSSPQRKAASAPCRSSHLLCLHCISCTGFTHASAPCVVTFVSCASEEPNWQLTATACLGKKNQLSRLELGGSFEKAGNSFCIISPNVLLGFSGGCRASLTLGPSGPLYNWWWVCF